MDIFYEFIVKRKNTLKDILIIMGAYFLAFFISFILLGYLTTPFGSFVLLIIVILWYLTIKLVKSRYIEYEYALTNNELDIDKIMGKQRRKHIMTVNLKEIEILAPITAYEFQNKNNISKTYDFSGICSNEEYFIDFNTPEGKTRIIFNPTQNMKDSFKLINPHAVKIQWFTELVQI